MKRSVDSQDELVWSSKQSIPGHLSSPTRPGYEARSKLNLVSFPDHHTLGMRLGYLHRPRNLRVTQPESSEF